MIRTRRFRGGLDRAAAELAFGALFGAIFRVKTLSSDSSVVFKLAAYPFSNSKFSNIRTLFELELILNLDFTKSALLKLLGCATSY